MVRRLALFGLGAGTLLAIAVLGVVIAAHVGVRRARGPLPAAQELEAAAAASTTAGPVRLWWLNTATQVLPRGAVLDRGRDPGPDTPHVMSHPAFLLEWPDGRLLLVDTGMTRDGALRFGRRIARVTGAGPPEPHGAAAEQLGPALRRVQAVVFTHLHADHVDGITALCSRAAHPLRVPMSPAQVAHTNYSTRAGRRLLRASPCARVDPLRAGTLLPVPGFPGVFLVPAGGHTPDSQIVFAFVRGADGLRRYALVGDIVNSAAAIDHDIPKPWLYRTLLVPEDEARLAEVRRYLRALRDEHGFVLLVSHDQAALEVAGVPRWQVPPD